MNKDIWHSTDKKPKHDHRIIINYSMDMYRDNGWDGNDNWDKFVVDNQVNKWCYLDELLSQSEELERYKKAVGQVIKDLLRLRVEEKPESWLACLEDLICGTFDKFCDYDDDRRAEITKFVMSRLV